MTRPKDRIYYVNNKELFGAYKTWYEDIAKCVAEEKEEPPIPNFIVDAMIKICTRLSYKTNFINYSFRDDLISDALYDCIRFAKKFNSLKSENPFAYITTIAFSAFLRRIDLEKTQSYIKAKIISETPIYEFFESLDGDDVDLQENFVEYMNENSANLTNNEPMAIKRKRKKQLEALKMVAEDIPEIEESFSFVINDNSLEKFLDEE